jgi:hypothetical protein
MATYYVDFGAANDGDGSTHTQAASGGAAGAYKTIVGKTFASGDIVWIRRSATALALAAAYTAALGGVTMAGWPISGDDLYASRPSGPQATWDADSATHAKITSAATANNFAPTGASSKFYRLWFDSSLTSVGSTPLVNLTGNSVIVSDVKATYSNAVNGSAVTLRCFSSTGTLPRIKNVYCKGSLLAANGTTNIFSVNSGASSGFVSGITIDVAYSVRGAVSTATGSACNLANTASNKSLIAEGITINFLATPAEHQGSAVIYNSGSVRARDITVNANASASYEGPGIYIFSSDCELLNLVGIGNVGSIGIAGANNTIEAKNWNINYPMIGTSVGSAGYIAGAAGNPLFFNATTSGGNTVIISNGTLNTNGAAKIYNIATDNVCIFNNTDYLAGSINRTGVTPQFDYEIFSMNHGKVAGAWHYANRYGTLDTSNTYRTGGSNFSIKGQITETDYAQNRRALPVSEKGRETIYINLASGTNTVTLYGAYKNYAGTNQAAPTLRDIGFCFDWFDSSNGFHVTSTFADGELTSDSSTWNNDTGVTPFKVAVTITSAAAQTVPFNIFASPEYDSAGYFYIDPAPVVS